MVAQHSTKLLNTSKSKFKSITDSWVGSKSASAHVTSNFAFFPFHPPTADPFAPVDHPNYQSYISGSFEDISGI